MSNKSFGSETVKSNKCVIIKQFARPRTSGLKIEIQKKMSGAFCFLLGAQSYIKLPIFSMEEELLS